MGSAYDIMLSMQIALRLWAITRACEWKGNKEKWRVVDGQWTCQQLPSSFVV